MSAQVEIPIQPVENPIICNPYDEPNDHWFYDEHGDATRPGHRRPAGYWYKTERVSAGQRALFLNEQRDLLDLVNLLRQDVKRWREAGYRGASSVTRDLLRHWWRYVSRAEAELRRGFDADSATAHDSVRPASLYFGDLLHSQILAFNPKYKEAEGALIGIFRRLNSDIAGNRDLLTYLRNSGKFFCAEENRELDLTLFTISSPMSSGSWRRNSAAPDGHGGPFTSPLS
ncbi:MAG: hypothetical protein ACR2HX_12510 [Pyrinomonadaceae bacterium]